MTASIDQVFDDLAEAAHPPRSVVHIHIRSAFMRALDRLVCEADPIEVRSRALLADALLSVRHLHAKQHGENRCANPRKRSLDKFTGNSV